MYHDIEIVVWRDRLRRPHRCADERFLFCNRIKTLRARRFYLSDPAATDLAASVLAIRDGAGHDERLLLHMRHAFDACAAQVREQMLRSPRAPVA